MDPSTNDPINLQPISTLTMADRVELRLLEFLKDNNYRPGDAIPKEVELAEALGVSRNVVREALSRFRMLGLIDSRKKRGMILKSPDLFKGMERVLDPKILNPTTLREIFELRLVIEMGLSDIIFLHLTSDDIEDLERIVNEPRATGKKIFRLEQEIEFHGRLYQITKNTTLYKFQSMLYPIFEFVIEQEIKMGAEAKSGKVSHQDLVELLKTGKSEKFREGMYAHLKPHFELLKNRIVD